MMKPTDIPGLGPAYPLHRVVAALLGAQGILVDGVAYPVHGRWRFRSFVGDQQVEAVRATCDTMKTHHGVLRPHWFDHVAAKPVPISKTEWERLDLYTVWRETNNGYDRLPWLLASGVDWLVDAITFGGTQYSGNSDSRAEAAQTLQTSSTIVERARDDAHRVVLEAALTVKRSGKPPSTSNVRAHMERANRLKFHPTRAGTPAWLEVLDTDGSSLGQIASDYFRTLVKRVRDSDS